MDGLFLPGEGVAAPAKMAVGKTLTKYYCSDKLAYFPYNEDGSPGMKKRLTSVSPIQLGIVLAVLYGLISLVIIVPIGAISSLGFMSLRSAAGTAPAQTFPVFPGIFLGGVMMLFIPVLQAAFGFICGALGGLLYNLVAKLTGGIEVTIEEAPEPWKP